jgi:hypothetical protein
VESREIPSDVESLVSVYPDQCDEVYRGDETSAGTYAGRKREAARVFLLHYCLDFRECFGGP